MAQQLGPEYLRVLAAVAAGRVVRDDCGGTKSGIWALHLVDGNPVDEVAMTLRYLSRRGLVRKPLIGPPTLTEDGCTALL